MWAAAAVCVLGVCPNEWTGEVLVFTTANDHPVEPRNLGRSFERIVQATELRPIRLHDLRHTTASLLKKLGVTARDWGWCWASDLGGPRWT